jgi:lipocalin
MCLSLAVSTNAHTMGLGSCPRVQPMSDFDMNKFAGEWYVIQKFATASSCMKYNFTQAQDNTWKVVQTRSHFVLDTIGIDHLHSYTGVLSTPDSDNKARMRVKFPMNIAGESEFVVFMTDYKNYAGIFTCQKILFGHTKCGSILSRKPTLDQAIINSVRQKLEDDGVDPDDFSIVDQSKCSNTDNATFKVKIDEKTFSSGNIGGFVKKVGGTIGSGFQQVGDVVGSGITKATDVGGDLIEKFGEQPEQPESVKHPLKQINELLDNAKAQENDAELFP